MSITRAIIFAAGFGMRMRPLTLVTPKPLLPVGNQAMISWIIQKLRAAGVKNICLNVSYLAEAFDALIHKETDCHLSLEPPQPWETGGAILNNRAFLGSDAFWGINGDTLWGDRTPSLLEQMKQAWDPTIMDLLLAIVPKSNSFGLSTLGDYGIDESGRLIRRISEIEAPYYYMGVQLAHPRLYAHEPLRVVGNTYFFDKAQEKGRLFGLIHQGPFFHFGTPEAYREGVPLFLAQS